MSGHSGLTLEERDYIGLSALSSAKDPVRQALQHDTDLRLDLGLGLSLGSDCCKDLASLKGSKFSRKRSYSELADDDGVSRHPGPLFSDSSLEYSATHDPSPPPKTQVVGWPPVCSYRRQTLPKAAEMFVKVNMDGMTVGRKVDLSAYFSYESLLQALEEMFRPSSSRPDTDVRHFLQAKDPDFVLTYEDKEGDWMLVGDVPWSMFTTAVRRLRITRASEANGTTVATSRPPRTHKQI